MGQEKLPVGGFEAIQALPVGAEVPGVLQRLLTTVLQLLGALNRRFRWPVPSDMATQTS